MSHMNYSQREYKNCTIASGASLSSVIDCKGFDLIAIDWPAAMTSTNFRVMVSEDGTTYVQVYYDTGSVPATFGIDQGKRTMLASLAIRSIKYMKLETVNGSNVATNEAAARSINVVIRPT